MMIFLAIIHVLVALTLVSFVLLQDPKGGAAGVFGGGGGSNTLFGATGATSFLTKATRATAVLFAVLCVALTVMTSKPGDSVLDDYTPAPSPATGSDASGVGTMPEAAPGEVLDQTPEAPATDEPVPATPETPDATGADENSGQ